MKVIFTLSIIAIFTIGIACGKQIDETLPNSNRTKISAHQNPFPYLEKVIRTRSGL